MNIISIPDTSLPGTRGFQSIAYPSSLCKNLANGAWLDTVEAPRLASFSDSARAFKWELKSHTWRDVKFT